MVTVRAGIVACALACGACGRLGFGGDGRGNDAGPDVDTVDLHLHAASGWSITQLVELTGKVKYDPADFTDGGGQVYSNAPSYVAALYPPFTAGLAVLAGRSVIEVAADGTTVVHGFRPAMPDTSGPDVPGRATFADLGSGKIGLWLTSASMEGGDGLFRIDEHWTIAIENTGNNTYPIGLDPAGTYDHRGVATIYFGVQTTLERQSGATLEKLGPLPAPVDELAAMGDALFLTVEDGDLVTLDRIGPGPDYIVNQLLPPTSLALAEGSTDGGLFGIHNESELVSISPTDGALAQLAWTDDHDWVWRSVCVPRPGHPLAGNLIVLESNRTLDRDRLLRIVPP